MIGLIEDLFKYPKTREESILLSNLHMKDSWRLSVIVINILNWLKVERKRTLWMQEGKKILHKPMKLNLEFLWCQSLIELVEMEPRFNKYFKITEKGLMFSDIVLDEEKELARKLAFDKYNPITFKLSNGENYGR